MATEGLNAGDSWELGHVQRPRSHSYELGCELIAAVRPYDPPAAAGIPLQVGDLGVEEGAVIEVVQLADAVAMLQDLWRMRVQLGRHVAGLFQQRHVDHRCRVALRARVAVPVPRPAEAAALLDNADVVNPGFLEPRRGDKAGEPAADEGNGHVVAPRLPLDAFGVRVFEVVPELALQL